LERGLQISKSINQQSFSTFICTKTIFHLPNFIWYILGSIVLLSVVVYFIQEKFIFKPEKLHADFEFKYDAPFKELFFDIEPGVRINGLHFFRENAKGLILYFHGNTRSIKGWARYARDFYRYDYDVILVDYRGFGKSTGKRTEKRCYQMFSLFMIRCQKNIQKITSLFTVEVWEVVLLLN
jgi:hypothetical protein